MNLRIEIPSAILKEQAAQEAAVAAQTADLLYMPIYVPAGDIALGLAADNIMPLLRDVPLVCLKPAYVWHAWADGWFHDGLNRWPVAVEGVDLQMAINNLTVCIRGRDIKPIFKMPGIAFLASLWFSSPDGPPIDKR